MIKGIAKGLEILVDRLISFTHYSAAVMICLLVILVFTNVMARYVFRNPLLMGVEMASVLMAMTVYLGAAAAQKLKVQPSVALFTRRLSLKWQNIILSFNFFVAVIYAGVFVWAMMKMATTRLAVGQTFDQMPWFPTGVAQLVTSVGFAVLGLACLYYFVISIKNLRNKHYTPELPEGGRRITDRDG